jgi:hypothetical protein
MSQITLTSTIKRNPELISSDVDGEKVMMSIENGEYFGLDTVGSRIWELIELPIIVYDLIQILLDEFDVDQAECEVDTLEFLNQLLVKNLLIVTPTK